jgi:hypothetical protein
MTTLYEQTPFPHAILDDFVAPEMLEECLASWPAEDWPGWAPPNDRQPGKRVSDTSTAIPLPCARLLWHMAHAYLGPDIPSRQDMMWDLTSLHGAGLFEMAPGSSLRRHMDAEAHPHTGLKRVVSVVLYLSEWEPSSGGELLLYPWPVENEGVEVKVEPRQNRLVAFRTMGAIHGVAPITALQSRRSLSLFGYYQIAAPSARRRALFLP